jgi:hypothetical protein
METLLVLAFDNLSSFDQGRIRKGLRQVEGLLAQICLSSPTTAAEKRRSVIDPGKEPPPPPRSLQELSGDPAFREFFKLQDNFQWNVTAQLLNSLDRLLSKNNDGAMEILIIQTLNLIQGTLLVHPPSRGLFQREMYMNVSLNERFSFLGIMLITMVASSGSSGARYVPSRTIINYHYPRLRLDRSTSERTNLRKTRRSHDDHLGLQVERDNKRGETQACGVPILLPHARDSFDPIRKCDSFCSGDATTKPQQTSWSLQPSGFGIEEAGRQ